MYFYRIFELVKNILHSAIYTNALCLAVDPAATMASLEFLLIGGTHRCCGVRLG